MSEPREWSERGESNGGAYQMKIELHMSDIQSLLFGLIELTSKLKMLDFDQKKNG